MMAKNYFFLIWRKQIKKVYTTLPVAFAVALAIIVLPQPGGPYNSTPLQQDNEI